MIDNLSMGFDVYKVLMSIIPLIFAITVHEAAHGWMAKRCGDNTAFLSGRITLNPKSHIDPIGTILVPILTYFLAGITFGWAKPVPVNYAYLKNPKKDIAWVAVAGPLSNFIMAFIWTIILSISLILSAYTDLALIDGIKVMSQLGIVINTSFMILNLIPILPLDGGRILGQFLPFPLSQKYQATEQYGSFIVMGLALLGILGFIMKPFVMLFNGLFLSFMSLIVSIF